METFKRINKIKNKMVTRTFSGKTRILVSVGDTVSPSDIIGEVRQSAGFRIANVALGLNVPPNKASGYALRKEGDKIFKGEVLAEKHQLFSKDTKKVYATVDGVIEHINQKNGQILVKITKKQENIPSGVWGKVVNIENDAKVTIETQVIEIVCKASRGYHREGSIKFIASNHEAIQEYMLKDEHTGKILIGGSMISKHVISKSINMGITGIVSGGINFEDLISVGDTSDIGVTLMITEGFGTISMNNELYTFLQKFDNFYCFVDGKNGTITIPLESLDEVAALPVKPELKVGGIVRVNGDDNIGIVAKIQEIIPEHKYLSGFILPSLRLLDGNKEYVVPQYNVEILA
jgi:hypothetical protein